MKTPGAPVRLLLIAGVTLVTSVLWFLLLAAVQSLFDGVGSWIWVVGVIVGAAAFGVLVTALRDAWGP